MANWWGLEHAGGQPYTYIKATWVVPVINVANSPKPSMVSIWVGFDGLGNQYVEQCGVGGFVDAAGNVSWQAWSEYYPAGAAIWSPTVYPVAAGDSITASVAVVPDGGGSYVTTVADTTQGWTAQTARTTAGLVLQNNYTAPPQFCAECVVETYYPENQLADFGSVTFTNITVSSAPGDLPFILAPTGSCTTSFTSSPETVTVTYVSGE